MVNITKFNIGIFGSGAGEMDGILPKAKELGQILGEHSDQVRLITGACTGIPYAVAKEAAKKGSEVWGFSPKLDLKGQKQFTPNDDIGIYAKIIYIPNDFQYANNDLVCKKYRNVLSTAACDAGIIISGRWGTLNEFTNLIDLQKVVGILTETGGVADQLPHLSQTISKEGQGQFIFDSKPSELVEEILDHLKSLEKL
jgi:predicted Rossmann-fold nucleotide-binding protein